MIETTNYYVSRWQSAECVPSYNSYLIMGGSEIWNHLHSENEYQKLNDLMNQQWICCFSYFVSCGCSFSPLCWCFVHELRLVISFSSRFTLTWFRYCYQDDCTKEDPLSQDGFRKLALPLPYSKQHHSKLVCYITKELMDTENPPMVLPNGYVYSTKVRIILMSSKSIFGIDFEKG